MTYKLIYTLLLAGLATLPAYSQTVGVLKSVEGQVSLSQAQRERVADAGVGILGSDKIVTGRQGSAALTLKDGTVVMLGPNTNLALADVKFDTTTQEGSVLLHLTQGTIRVVTGWLGKLHPEQVKVITPTTVVGVRGTDFIVEVP
ncbi:FecR family protein [Rhodoferax sp.]|uniref:FecR family protein n=1 Tax=Rhodoferax sp. TaxID=50421 RepID=UPI002619E2A2|nr:FecR family protein [Rhodoferax sp.]MDD5480595.1 FecR family protein [Rhodoferax sp.]